MRTDRFDGLLRLSVLGLIMIAFTAGCAEAVGTGVPVKIPTVLVECTTPQCKSSTSPYVFVWATPYRCDWQFIDNATIVNSTTATCNSTSGCRVTMPSTWLLGSTNQNTSTVPSGSYTVCGRINNNRTLPHSVSTNDVTIEIGSVSFVENMGLMSLGGTTSIGQWVDQ